MEYNENDSKKNKLQVFVRVRPPIASEIDEDISVHVINESSLSVRTEKQNLSCEFDAVFNEVSEQNNIFENVKSLLDSVLDGYNACIFAYGQTSAGKTHTMLGPNGGKNLLQQPGSWGILPRSASYLLNSLHTRSKKESMRYLVKASFLQIYNEQLYDLLSDGSYSRSEDATRGKNMDSILKIREIPSRDRREAGYATKEVYVSGLSEFRVHSSQDVMSLLEIGASNRTTKTTDFNLTSSRSHAILSLNFEVEVDDEASGQKVIHRSKLNLVDLAGSEKMTNVVGSMLNADDRFAGGLVGEKSHVKELTSINKSLSALGEYVRDGERC